MFFFSKEFKLNLNWEDLIVFFKQKAAYYFPCFVKGSKQNPDITEYVDFNFAD